MKRPRAVWHPFGIMKQTIVFEDTEDFMQWVKMMVSQQVWFDTDFIVAEPSIVTEELK